MNNKNEAFSRVIIDAMLADQGWNTTDPNAVRFEVVMADGTRADYVLCGRLDFLNAAVFNEHNDEPDGNNDSRPSVH